MNTNLIQCGDHNWCPWHIVCIHLIDGSSDEWIQIPLSDDDLREIDGDWVCPECADNIENPDVSCLRPVCMHCLRDLRKKLDKNYTDEC